MAFDVTWFAVHSFGLDKAPALLSSLDRKGIVTTAERDWKSELSLERVGVLEFLLQVHSSEDQDFGNYYCSVTPWVKSPTGSWQKEAEIYSKPIFVTVKMDGKDVRLCLRAVLQRPSQVATLQGRCPPPHGLLSLSRPGLGRAQKEGKRALLLPLWHRVLEAPRGNGG